MLFTTLSVLVVCHFVADFTPLSTKAMLQAKAVGRPALPIWCHAGVHTILQYFALLFLGVHWQLAGVVALIQLVSHGNMDTLKGRLQATHSDMRDPAKPAHWILFGSDQMAHILTIVFEVWFLHITHAV